jgi:hypothetical protein
MSRRRSSAGSNQAEVVTPPWERVRVGEVFDGYSREVRGRAELCGVEERRSVQAIAYRGARVVEVPSEVLVGGGLRASAAHFGDGGIDWCGGRGPCMGSAVHVQRASYVGSCTHVAH